MPPDQPSANFSGTAERLTVISANVLNPFFRIGRVDMVALLRRLEAFAGLAEAMQAEILLCQEIGRSKDFRVDTWLAERMGFSSLYHRANGRAGRVGREEGLAILSRYPLRNPVSIMLSRGLWRRPALGAVIDTPLGEIAIYTTHFSLRPWRNRRQPERLRAWVEATAAGRPAIIGGDFNATAATAHIAALNERWIDTWRMINPTADGYTHELRLFGRVVARRRIDYIFLRPTGREIRVANCSHQNTIPPFSDHLAVVARFERSGA